MSHTIPSWVNLFYLLGAGQGIFLFLILLMRPSTKKPSDYWMAVLVAVYSFQLFYIFLTYSGYIRQVPFLYGTTAWFFFLLNPLFYFYVRNFFGRTPFRSIDLLHFLPYVLLAVNSLPFYLSPVQEKLRIYEMQMATGGIHPVHWFYSLVSGIQIVQGGTYLFICYRLLKLHETDFPDQVKQIKRILIFFAMFTIGATTYILSTSLFKIDYYHPLCYGIKVFMSLSIYMLAFVSLTKPESLQVLEAEAKKYKNSPLSTQQSKVLADQIMEYLNRESTFLAHNLNLDSLSSELGISVHYISQAINENFRCSFPELINSLRVEHAKKLLANEDLKIMAVAFDSGFNNKVTFNTAFKKFTGLTPGEYRKQLALPK